MGLDQQNSDLNALTFFADSINVEGEVYSFGGLSIPEQLRDHKETISSNILKVDADLDSKKVKVTLFGHMASPGINSRGKSSKCNILHTENLMHRNCRKISTHNSNLRIFL